MRMTLKVESWVLSKNHSLRCPCITRGEEEKRRAHIALGVASVARIPVWFRSKGRLKNDKERDFRSLPSEKWNESSNLSLIPYWLL